MAALTLAGFPLESPYKASGLERMNHAGFSLARQSLQFRSQFICAGDRRRPEIFRLMQAGLPGPPVLGALRMQYRRASGIRRRKAKTPAVPWDSRCLKALPVHLLLLFYWEKAMGRNPGAAPFRLSRFRAGSRLNRGVTAMPPRVRS